MLGRLMVFSDVNGVVIGDLTITRDIISLNISGQNAVFIQENSFSGHQTLQLCSNGSTLTLYDRCVSLQTQPFGPVSLADVMLIGIFGDPQKPVHEFTVSFVSRKPVVIILK